MEAGILIITIIILVKGKEREVIQWVGSGWLDCG